MKCIPGLLKGHLQFQVLSRPRICNFKIKVLSSTSGYTEMRNISGAAVGALQTGRPPDCWRHFPYLTTPSHTQHNVEGIHTLTRTHFIAAQLSQMLRITGRGSPILDHDSTTIWYHVGFYCHFLVKSGLAGNPNVLNPTLSFPLIKIRISSHLWYLILVLFLTPGIFATSGIKKHKQKIIIIIH